uniref:Uncharacterized protein n=1 Tax=Romanomermis culicivorax TaxID=13658 RepID=A0A915KLW5_ROMCU
MGHQFAANTDVYIPVYDIHQDPNLWPDPDRFHPERIEVKIPSKDTQQQHNTKIPENEDAAEPAQADLSQDIMFSCAEMLSPVEVCSCPSLKRALPDDKSLIPTLLPKKFD